MTPSLTIFVGGPFSSALQVEGNSIVGFDSQLRQKLDLLHRSLQELDVHLLSSHMAEKFGQDVHEESLVLRDNAWLRMSNGYLALLPLDAAGNPWRSDGTFIEIGQALGLGKPVIMLMEEPANPAWSFYVRNLHTEPSVTTLDYRQFTADPVGVLRSTVVAPLLASLTRNEHIEITNVDTFLSCCRYRQETDLVNTIGLELAVTPGVFSPRFSGSSEFLISRWKIPAGTRVLDIGCGCGILGIAALREGAAFLTAVDMNPLAVANTEENLRRLGLTHRAEVLLSNAYEKVKGKYDVIVANPPYWNRPARDDLERSCYDEDYRFLRVLIEEAAEHARPGCLMFIVFSNQGDYNLVHSLLRDNGWSVEALSLQPPSNPGGHIRIVWEARLK